MEILTLLIPISLFMGGVGLVAFFWAVRAHQFEDPKGDSQRVLSDEFDERPKQD